MTDNWCCMLSCVVLVAATICCVGGAPREKRDLIQLVELLDLMNNRSGLAFNNYGCYCGWGGQGAPVDQVDRCCAVHDNCYGAVELEHCHPKWNHYKYKVLAHDTERLLQCTGLRESCYENTCECDVQLATCVSKAEYHPEHKSMSQVTCYRTKTPKLPPQRFGPL